MFSILLAEKDANISKLWERGLKKAGYTAVVPVYNVADVEAYLAQNRPNAILVALPLAASLDLLRAVDAHDPTGKITRILLHTSTIDDIYPHRHLFTQYFRKPLSYLDIISIGIKLLAKHRTDVYPTVSV